MKLARAISLMTALAALPAVGQTVVPGTAPKPPSLQDLAAQIAAHQAYTVADAWHEYETSCGAAIADPGQYLAQHPAVSPQGMELMSQSPDKQVVLMTNYPPWPIWQQIMYTGVPGELQIFCRVAAGLGIPDSDPARVHAQMQTRVDEIRKLFGTMPDTTLVGGKLPLLGWMGMMGPVHNSPDEENPRLFGIQTMLAGKKRYVQILLEGNTLTMQGLYAYRAGAQAKTAQAGGTANAANAPAKPAQAPAPASPAPSGATAQAAMSKATEICLRSYRDPPQAVTQLRAAGFAVTPGTNKGDWSLTGPGISGQVVTGNVAAGAELNCTIRSTHVTLAEARAIGGKLSQSLFPGMVQQGAPEGGKGPCDGQSIFAPRKLIWMHYARAGNIDQCVDDGTSAIIIY